ncbi:MAG TPA: hypothetical protein VHD56_01850 [Tepidisphaeraceae bacterium]|nr:hypothetical protein [Tepidisphaeraceae bacterium]
MNLTLAYRLFVDPLPIYSYWYWLLIPLCLLFSIVYKAVKCDDMSQVPRAALASTFYILLGMAAAAAVLAGVVKAIQ